MVAHVTKLGHSIVKVTAMRIRDRKPFWDALKRHQMTKKRKYLKYWCSLVRASSDVIRPHAALRGTANVGPKLLQQNSLAAIGSLL